jgi:hypothetical protein
MHSKRIILILAILLLIIHGCGSMSDEKSKSADNPLPAGSAFVKPYRVLVIISNQWTDPMSYNIDPERVKGTDFLDVVNMLKIWGVPFDILRLDEQRLQINRFLDGVAKPNYGCVIWMADPDELSGYSASFQTMRRVVMELGISMIALFDNIKTKEIADLAGVDYSEVMQLQLNGSTAKFTITGDHFITRDASGVTIPDSRQLASNSIPAANGITQSAAEPGEDQTIIDAVDCSARPGISVLGSIGTVPQLVVRDIDETTKVVWIGGGRDWFRKYPVMRGIFRKALVYSMGYGIFNDNFENGYIFIMDDVGCGEHSYSLRWHYPTPARDTLIKYLIEPLEKHGLMMVQNITPGFADPENRIIVSPWTVKPFRDRFGNWQDYGSTKEGLDEGLRRGVFEIQPHRAWSHMNWDLESPPGPWWGSPVDGELAEVDWYNEVVDVRRGHSPVPSNDLLFIYKTGIDAIKKSFGVVPLAAEVRPGAEILSGKPGGYDNGRVAAIAGLGVSRECYVGFDYTIEFSMMMPEQFTCHDLDLTAPTDGIADETEEGWDKLLTLTTEQLMGSSIAGGRRINLRDNLDWIESKLDRHWMGFNETCAYLHTTISNNHANSILLNYDEHYCRYFGEKPSYWTLELSDTFREKLGTESKIAVDGGRKTVITGSKQLIEIPAGTGTHTIQFVGRNN